MVAALDVQLRTLAAETLAACSQGSAADFASKLSDTHSGAALSTDLATDLEIVLRGELQRLLGDNEAKAGGKDDELFRVLRFSLDVASESASLGLVPSLAKLPFALLEEIFSSVSILRAERLWSRLEELTDEITKPELFSKGQLVVLRICNSILRKLSKTYNTEFCGRVLMFLAAVYPLSEKSALNTLGQVNTGNTTTFDSQADFAAAIEEQNSATVESMTRAMSDDGEVDSEAAYSLPDTLPKDASAKVLGEGGVEYASYATFWGIQSYLSADSKAMTSESWTSFVRDAEKVFELLATFKPAIAEKPVSDSAASYFGCKYLTSAKLLGLQLTDPQLRAQIASQILFFVQSLRRRPPAFLTPPPQPTVVSLSKGKTASKPASKTPQPPAPAVPPPNTALEKFLLEASGVEEKALALIESSPGGAGLAATVRRLAYEEARLQRWKAAGCPPYERSSGLLDIKPGYTPSWAPGEPVDGRGGYAAPRFPRSTGAAFLSVLTANRRNYTFDCQLDSAKEVAKYLADGVPTFKSFVQDYLDAEDPEQGIEDSYHPKHNSVYCWRLRRLLSQERASALEAMSDGNISKGLVKMGLLSAAKQTEDAESPQPCDESLTADDIEAEDAEPPAKRAREQTDETVAVEAS